MEADLQRYLLDFGKAELWMKCHLIPLRVVTPAPGFSHHELDKQDDRKAQE